MEDQSSTELPQHWFERVDASDDALFYAAPRFVAHIDQATIDALTRFYLEFIPENGRVLDLMSSWISHLPDELSLSRVSGLGMNAAELERNKHLTDWCVHDLNVEPILPYPTGSFDRVLIAVSIQYLTRPLEVMASVRDVLERGGSICVAMSHRLFPTKAIAAFQYTSLEDRVRLVRFYLERCGFEDVAFRDRSPVDADPLWLVTGSTPHP